MRSGEGPTLQGREGTQEMGRSGGQVLVLVVPRLLRLRSFCCPPCHRAALACLCLWLSALQRVVGDLDGGAGDPEAPEAVDRQAGALGGGLAVYGGQLGR